MGIPKEDNSHYRFAKDIDGNTVSADDVVRSEYKQLRPIFYCLGCGSEMIPVLGEVRAKHFRHKVDCKCDGETYLHRLGKEILKKRFDSSTIFEVKYFVEEYCDKFKKCRFKHQETDCHSRTTKTLNLREFYDTCTLEKWDPQTNKKPDLMLSDSTGRYQTMWFEICVTNPCSLDKKESKKHIIEFKINNETQAFKLAQIEIFQNIFDSSEKRNASIIGIEFLNFKPSSEAPRIKSDRDWARYAIDSKGIITATRPPCHCIVEYPVNDEIAIILDNVERDSPDDVINAQYIFSQYEIGNYRKCEWCLHFLKERNVCLLANKMGTRLVPYPEDCYYCKSYAVPIHYRLAKLITREGITKEDLQNRLKNLPSSPPPSVDAFSCELQEESIYVSYFLEDLEDSMFEKLEYLPDYKMPWGNELNYTILEASRIFFALQHCKDFESWELVNPFACYYDYQKSLILDLKSSIASKLRFWYSWRRTIDIFTNDENEVYARCSTIEELNNTMNRIKGILE